MKTQISISRLKPEDVGENIVSIVQKLEQKVIECEKEGYTSKVAKTLGLIVQLGFMDTKDWIKFINECPEQKSEIETQIFYSHMLIIRLNNIAQTHLNKIKMPSITEQMNTSEDLQKYFSNIEFID